MIPKEIYSTEQVRELDRIAIEDHGIPGYALMQRAGLAAFNLLKKTWPSAISVTVYCGLGNNGGDGYVIARLAADAGMNVLVIQLGDASKIKGDALKAKQDWESNAGTFNSHKQADVIVDAIFGTGLTRAPEGQWHDAIQEINHSKLPVLAVDVPSGLDSDTGMPLGISICAETTISFIGIKQGLLTAEAGNYTGRLVFDSLGIPDAVFDSISPAAQQLDNDLLQPLLPARKPSTHKGDCGHALIVGGAVGMQGAGQMAAEACARCGAGLTTLASEVAHHPRPEIMTCSSTDETWFMQALHRCSVVALGPGLGTHPHAQRLFNHIIQQEKPLVVDADALNLLAAAPQNRSNWILTPHPGEAARLLQCSTKEIQQDRFIAVKAIQQRYGGVCVLKGFGSLISDGTELSICTAGNPGMACGGMGDVLTGIICSMLAQKLSLIDAAKVGVYVHARAADLAAADGERGILASDLFPFIKKLVNPNHSKS